MEAMRRNIWILGGTGYIGRALVSFLAADPANHLHLLLHKNTPYRFLESFNTFTGSISKFDSHWFERYPPDVVFHLARPAGWNRVTREWAARRGNSANRRLAELMANLKKPPVIVYVSGSLLYGYRDSHDPAMEDSPISPASFAKHYYKTELPWLNARKYDLLDVRFARPGWIVGADSWFRKFFWEPMRQWKKIPCYGSGNQLMSLVHINDCAALIDALSRYGSRGQNLNVFTGAPVRQEEFCELLAGITGMGIMKVDHQKLRILYGTTIARALTTSIPMGTQYPEIYGKAAIRFTDQQSLLADVIGFLKNKQGVLSPGPANGFIE